MKQQIKLQRGHTQQSDSVAVKPKAAVTENGYIDHQVNFEERLSEKADDQSWQETFSC